MRVMTLAVLAIALLAAGCGRGGDRAAVGSVTDTFFAALRSGDGDKACEQLSPATRAQLESEEKRDCRDAVTELKLEAGSASKVGVYVDSAAVELSNGETAFLDKLAEGWRLSAVGCTPRRGERGDGPYDCELED